MKRIIDSKLTMKGIALACALFVLASCTENFEEINTDPNNPTVVKTSSLMTNAQKGLLDDIYDEWFSGRQSYLYSQYFAQRNYTEEDRYQLRQPVNNNYWTYIYGDIMDLQEVINLNTKAGAEGSQNQIAAARILKAWAFQILTDTYGDIPYFDALKAEGEVAPSYSPQNEIYADLIKELSEASDQINVNEVVFTEGDVIYGGNAVKWKRFANSLKLRVAIRMSKADPNYMTYINEAVADGVFQSNADNATFRFLGATPNAAPLYDAYYYSNRNDFTLSKTFVDLLKGVNDAVNSKTNPFVGMFDPRLSVWAAPVGGEYQGMPYGIANDQATAARAGTIDFTQGGLVTSGTLALTYMDYAEVCFILSEANGWDQTWYQNGVAASLAHWKSEAGVAGVDVSNYDNLVTTYMAALPAASEENVLTQKYIALFLQGGEAWSEYRRTGYPQTLVHPGEISWVSPGGTQYTFVALAGTDIPRRINYPVIEQTLNPTSYKAVVARQGADDLSTKMWWDK